MPDFVPLGPNVNTPEEVLRLITHVPDPDEGKTWYLRTRRERQSLHWGPMTRADAEAAIACMRECLRGIVCPHDGIHDSIRPLEGSEMELLDDPSYAWRKADHWLRCWRLLREPMPLSEETNAERRAQRECGLSELGPLPRPGEPNAWKPSRWDVED